MDNEPAEFPSVGKISYKWLAEVVNRDVDPFGDDHGFDTCGVVMYHLRHLGLIREDLIEFDNQVSEKTKDA